MQRAYLDDIERLFDGQVRSLLSLLETEVRGVEMLRRMAGLLYREQPVGV